MKKNALKYIDKVELNLVNNIIYYSWGKKFMQARFLTSLIGLAAFYTSSILLGKGVPIHGCTFHKSPFSSNYKSCAQPKVKIGGCTKYTPLGVPYKGNLVSMYLPDYLIETGLYSGRSLFEKNPQLSKHLGMAYSWQQSKKTLKYPYFRQ